MNKIIFITALVFFISTTLMAQMKVANYSFGKPGTDKFEHIEFWTKDGIRTEINYAYGKDRKEVKLQYLGKDKINGSICFKVKFTNNYTLYIILKGLKLQG